MPVGFSIQLANGLDGRLLILLENFGQLDQRALACRKRGGQTLEVFAIVDKDLVALLVGVGNNPNIPGLIPDLRECFT